MWCFLGRSVLVVLIVSCSLFAEPIPYAIVDLGASGEYASSYAVDINNRGEVIGYLGTYYGYRGDTFFWSPRDGMTTFGAYLRPEAMNDHGQVVGYASSIGPWIWDSENGMQALRTLADPRIDGARGINNLGQVVGVADNQPFVWDPTAGWGFRFLGNLGGDYGEGFAINDRMEVVGYSQTAKGFLHAFYWRLYVGMSDVDPPDYSSARAAGMDINSDGNWVGFAARRDAAPIRGRRLYTSHFLDCPYGVGGAFGINAEGVAIGISGDRAVMWDENETCYLLQDLLVDRGDWICLEEAVAINDRGQIVGSGRIRGGERRAFLMTPIPEPSVMSLILIGWCVVTVRRNQPHEPPQIQMLLWGFGMPKPTSNAHNHIVIG